MRRFMRICKNKGADQLHGGLNQKFEPSSHLQGLYSQVCVLHGRNPKDWFSHDMASTKGRDLPCNH